MKRRLGHLLGSGLLVLSAAILSLVVVELVMRGVGFEPAIAQPWHLKSRSTYRIADQDLIMIAPRFRQDNFYTVDRSLKTVVTLGDSFTEGHPVTTGEYDYPAAMRRLLHRSSCDINLINLGLGDSGPDQHLRLMQQHLLPRLQPDIVVWQFYANDIGDNLRQAVFDIQGDALVPLTGIHWIFLRQKIYDFIPLPDSVKETSPVVRLLLRGLEVIGDRRLPQEPNEMRRAWSLNKIRLAIQEMDRLSDIHGFELYYVLVAPQAVYLADVDHPVITDAYAQLHAILRDRSDFLGGRFSNAQAQPREDEFQVPSSAVERPNIFADHRRDSNPIGDRHFNEIGYQLLAELVAERVAAQCQ